MVSFVAVLEQAWQVQQFLCANHTKIPCFDREIKYLDFVSGHLASAETQWQKIIQVTKSIQVASTYASNWDKLQVKTILFFTRDYCLDKNKIKIIPSKKYCEALKL